MASELPLWQARRSIGFSFLFIISILATFVFMQDRFFFALNLLFGYSTSQQIAVAGNVDTRSYKDMKRLEFKTDGTFKIGIFEDLHFGEGEDNPPEWGWGPISDRKSIDVINAVLSREKPDLVVLNGDLITGENTYLENATHYLDQIVEPLVSRRIPWAATYGNHDQQFNLSSQRILERERVRYPDLSYTRSMLTSDAAGISNFVLPIYSPTSGDNAKPKLLLWFFDSKGGSKFQTENPHGKTPDERRVPIDDHVDTSVVDWFLETNAHFMQQYGHAIPSLAFVHIPVFAMYAFQQRGVDPHQYPGIDDDNPLAPQSVKSGRYTERDVPFMKALVDVGVKAVFSGHDHGDDWCFRWNSRLDGMTVAGKGLFLCFSRHSGYGGYGSWIRGGRQILLHEGTLEKDLESWIRLEDGTSSGHVMLNETYGSDIYPVANSGHSHRNG